MGAAGIAASAPRTPLSSSATNSCTAASALGSRASRFLARSRAITASSWLGTLGLTSLGRGGCTSTCCWASSAGESPIAAGLPVAASYRTSPRPYRSVRTSAGSPRTRSGAT